jgi:hypothetical protein
MHHAKRFAGGFGDDPVNEARPVYPHLRGQRGVESLALDLEVTRPAL